MIIVQMENLVLIKKEKMETNMKTKILLKYVNKCIAFIMLFENFSQLQYDDAMGLINLHNEKLIGCKRV